MSWIYHVPWVFTWPEFFLGSGKLLSLVFFLTPNIVDTCSDTLGWIVEETSPSSPRKVPFFFFLASDPGRIGKGSNILKVRPKAGNMSRCLRQIPVCHGGKKCKFSSWPLWIEQNPASFLLVFAQVACDLSGTPTDHLITEPAH